MRVYETMKVDDNRLYEKKYNSDGLFTEAIDAVSGTTLFAYDDYENITRVNLVKDSATVLTEDYSYNGYSELSQKIISGAVTQTYTYVYKTNAARDLEYEKENKIPNEWIGELNEENKYWCFLNALKYIINRKDSKYYDFIKKFLQPERLKWIWFTPSKYSKTNYSNCYKKYIALAKKGLSYLEK